MLHLEDVWLCRPRLLVFHLSVFVFLTQRCGGQPQVVGPSEPIVATVGDDVTLPCHLSPAADASEQTVEWARPDLSPRFVFVWRDGVELKTKKHPLYVERASLHVSKMKHGDISLKLSKVKLSDEGTYRCFMPTINRDSSVQLVVGSVSSLIISLLRTESDEEVVLQCEAKGWYPEPEVFWLDGEGNLLSAGPPETVRGPDDLYTVSRRLTVEKSDSFTCRVQQKNINQTRETHICIPDGFFSPPRSSAAHIITVVSLAVVLMVLMVVLTAVFVAWRRRRKQNSGNFTTTATTTRGSDNTELPERPHLLAEEESEALQVMSESIEDLDGEKTRLDEQFKKVEKEYKDVVQLLNLLTHQKRDVENQMQDIILQQAEIQNQNQNQPEENNTKHHEKDSLETNPRLDEEKREFERKLQDVDTILKAVHYGETVMREKKTELNKIKEQINKQLEETNVQRNEGKSEMKSEHCRVL